ncbi:hypothetical protein KK062_22320 [Fulvivirgaceae bacterium PWU5]|uniref:Uncharacterized protein n=1 Tax=Dawidia cretensis TaxID=2782350 RepID=A0AAP2E1F3_9BACT|nr:hypothetical protein [Dawidia cretensis]MBT1710995.1 hypothetical protein [Dawidia cretensis]
MRGDNRGVDDTPFLEAMADDMQWMWTGSGPWSRTFVGAGKLRELKEYMDTQLVTETFQNNSLRV